jgi:hypothetical protein
VRASTSPASNVHNAKMEAHIGSADFFIYGGGRHSCEWRRGTQSRGRGRCQRGIRAGKQLQVRG